MTLALATLFVLLSGCTENAQRHAQDEDSAESSDDSHKSADADFKEQPADDSKPETDPGGRDTGSTKDDLESETEAPESDREDSEATCKEVFAEECGLCLEAQCCGEVASCVSTMGCVDCVTGQGSAGCVNEEAADSLLSCAGQYCLDECSTPGNAEFDLVNCLGPASTSGTVGSDVTPQATLGTVEEDPSGNIKVILIPSFPMSDGDVIVGVYFFAMAGQYSYPPNGTVGCAVFEYTGSGYTVIDTTQLCEVNLTKLEFASTEGVCDGIIEGTFDGLFSGNQPIVGSFQLPMAIAESQVDGPACQPANGPCSKHEDCCSQSCSMYLGACN